MPEEEQSSTVIPAINPVVIPATEEKVYPHTWVRNLQVRSHGVDTESSLYVELVPYDASTGEIDHGHPREIRIPFWGAMNTVPEAQSAMHAVFAAIPALESYAASLNSPPEE